MVAGGIVAATRLPWVADFRDPWVGNAFRPGRNDDTWAGRKHRRLESEVYENADVVIFNTPRAMEDAVSRAGERLANKSIVIPNGFDPALFETQAADVTEDRAKKMPLTLVHPGGFYGKRNVDGLLQALGKMKRNGQLSERDLRLELIGADRPGRVREKEQIAKLQLEGIVNLSPPVPHEECIARISQANVLLLVQTEAPLCVPGKLYEYIAIGKPVLTISTEGSTSDLVNAECLGPCVDPDDAVGLEMAVRELLDQHHAGQLPKLDASISKRYDGRNQMAQFDAVFRRAIGRSIESISASKGLRE
ncbi:glycosyltransferase [Stieleria sp. TO1_6]|nr:glycosyltransferase [Stieleria tagensis]MCO8122494.1 glycosyltransferase [Stieleria tagensis]